MEPSGQGGWAALCAAPPLSMIVGGPARHQRILGLDPAVPVADENDLAWARSGANAAAAGCAPASAHNIIIY
jgi:hypothetical protein